MPGLPWRGIKGEFIIEKPPTKGTMKSRKSEKRIKAQISKCNADEKPKFRTRMKKL